MSLVRTGLGSCEITAEGKLTDPARSWFANLLFPCSARDQYSEDRTLLGPLTTAAANVYGSAQYGKIPEPAKPVPIGVPPLIGGALSPTFDIEAWWAESIAQSRLATIEAQQQEIDRAVAVGTYSPEGNLPITAEGLGKYGPWILLAAGALVLVVVLRRQ